MCRTSFKKITQATLNRPHPLIYPPTNTIGPQLTQIHVDHRVRCDAKAWRCVHVQMEPRAVLVLIGRSIQEHHFALVPALIRLLDVGEIQRGSAVRRVGGHARYAAHVAVAAVRRIVLVPDVDRDFLALVMVCGVRFWGRTIK